MFNSIFRPSACFRILVLALACFLIATSVFAQTAPYVESKTPYTPQQSASTYEPPPSGFSPVFTQMVARHGSRGLSSPGSDLIMYNMWAAAQASGQLTKLGQRMGVDMLRVIQANTVLGCGVPGITTPGYGNLTQVGIAEHTQLAQRMAARVSPMLQNAVPLNRQVIVSTSGVNRAIDSGHFFTQSLANTVSGLGPLIVNSAALTAYPVNKPVAQPAGVNRFDLYFHKLVAKTDLPATTDPYYATYQKSLAYQKYLASDPTMLSKVNSILYNSSTSGLASAVLEASFTPAFVNALANGSTSYSNTGTYTFSSANGQCTNTISGDGKTTVSNLFDAANTLYAVYQIIPGMIDEVPVNLGKYFPVDGQLQTFEFLANAQDFYQAGPGFTEEAPITYAMSQSLLDDFFSEGNAIAAGNYAHAAKLRFSHAEIIMPFANKLGLPNASTTLPESATYTYANNPWRASQITPYVANIQWDMYSNGSTLLVKMYYNEKETDFPPACNSARFTNGSHYYTYSGIKACYGY